MQKNAEIQAGLAGINVLFQMKIDEEMGAGEGETPFW